MYIPRYRPKERKKRRKVKKKVVCVLKLLVLLCEIEMLRYAKCFLQPRQEGAMKARKVRKVRGGSNATQSQFKWGSNAIQVQFKRCK